MIAEYTHFRQIPVWEDDTEFTISGKQLRAIYDLFKAYTPFATAMEPILVNNLDNGKITIKYEDLQGHELSEKAINEMLERCVEEITNNIKEKGAQ